MTRHGAQDLRSRASRAALRLANMVRRVTLGSSQGGSWGFQGYAIPDLRGGSSTTTEGDGYDETEIFPGIGIYARPGSDDDAEALLLQVGGEANHPVIAAVRNEAARARYVEEFGDVEPGEIAVFNSGGTSRILITAAGNVEITVPAGKEILLSAGGATDKLVTRTEFLKHGHATAATGPVSSPIVAPAPSVDPAFPGTSVVKGE